jgi:hypothetical protein
MARMTFNVLARSSTINTVLVVTVTLLKSIAAFLPEAR